MNIKEKLKDICLKLWAFILSFSKKHKIIAFIICLILLNSSVYHIQQVYSSIRYGKYSKLANYPKDNFFDIWGKNAFGVRIDGNNVLFFIGTTKKGYAPYDFDLQTKKFKKYKTKFAFRCLYFAEKIEDKIYLVFKDDDFTHLYNILGEHIVIYDYKNDMQENVFSDEIINPKRIKLNNAEVILYKRHKLPNEKSTDDNSEFEYRIYNPKTNMVKTINIPKFYVDCDTTFVGQTKNGLALFSTGEKRGKRTIYAIDLNKNKIIFNNDEYIFYDGYPHYIWLGDDRFLSAEMNKHRIRAFKIEENNGKIFQIGIKEFGAEEWFKQTKVCKPQNSIVLNSDTVIFSTGFITPPGFNSTKETYLYKVSTNEFIKLTDFFYKTPSAQYVELDEKRFILYDANLYTWINNFFVNSGSIYIFKLKKEM